MTVQKPLIQHFKENKTDKCDYCELWSAGIVTTFAIAAAIFNDNAITYAAAAAVTLFAGGAVHNELTKGSRF